MIVKIGAVTYDTDKAELVKKYTYGTYGDPAGYEVVLYRMRRKNGKIGGYIVCGCGGPDSPYPVARGNRILSEAGLKKFYEEHEGK